jgi:ATP-dependent protease Clp ATPase subunit
MRGFDAMSRFLDFLGTKFGLATERSLPSPLRCSFCRKTGEKVRNLVGGPTVWICNECVALAEPLMEELSAHPPQGSLDVCSFCNKRREDAKRLIGGPTVFMCDECYALADEIVAKDFPSK